MTTDNWMIDDDGLLRDARDALRFVRTPSERRELVARLEAALGIDADTPDALDTGGASVDPKQELQAPRRHDALDPFPPPPRRP
jgi:hypothetical protein